MGDANLLKTTDCEGCDGRGWFTGLKAQRVWCSRCKGSGIRFSTEKPAVSDSDQSPQGTDPKGLSAKHESAARRDRPEKPEKSGFGEPLND
jgi:DnaJ-class molecular chaperone